MADLVSIGMAASAGAERERAMHRRKGSWKLSCKAFEGIVGGRSCNTLILQSSSLID